MKRTVMKSVFQFLTGALIVNLLWLCASVMLDRPSLPLPGDVYASLFSSRDAVMWPHIFASLFRIVAGVGIASLLGIVIGIWMGFSKVSDRIWSAVIYFTYPVPKLALLPAVMILAGLGDAAKIIMIVLIVVFQVIVATRDAVRKIPSEWYDIMVSLGASRCRMLFGVTMPAIMPDIFTALRVAVGSAVSVLFVTETYGTDKGLGYYIVDAWMRIDYIDMYSGIIVLSVMGSAIFFLIDALSVVMRRNRMNNL